MSMGLSVEEHDQEGRVITAEYSDFYGMYALPFASFLAVKLSPLESECAIQLSLAAVAL